MKYLIFTLFIPLLFTNTFSQNYTSYFTGDTANVETIIEGGICLMGGATENDSAMIWFLKQSGGGDIVVIRATGSDGYNDYLYSGLGVAVNSVETLVIPSVAAASDQYVIRQIHNAEAIWIAGGDQYNYVSSWKDTPVEDELNGLIEKGVVIGGTSAGMAILGQGYFSAANGTTTSATALSNPFDNSVTLGYNDFIDHPLTKNVITDTHYDNPDRRGRHTAFLAKMVQAYGNRFYGIASEEYVAVCIDKFGTARAYGDYPAYEDYAYFLVTNCVSPIGPESCQSGTPLTWDRNQQALKVYKMNATPGGNNTFETTDWKTNSGGGAWENWWVTNGVLNTLQGALPPECSSTAIHPVMTNQPVVLYPNPVTDELTLSFKGKTLPATATIYSKEGKKILTIFPGETDTAISVQTLSPGYYYIICEGIGAFPFHKQ